MLHQAGQLHDQLIQPFILSEKKMEECFVFTHRGNFQALKVRDLKLSYASQLCDNLKNRIIKIGIYIEKYHR
jgi:hypothetical protein